jgi:hypothetical protein
MCRKVVEVRPRETNPAYMYLRTVVLLILNYIAMVQRTVAYLRCM